MRKGCGTQNVERWGALKRMGSAEKNGERWSKKEWGVKKEKNNGVKEKNGDRLSKRRSNSPRRVLGLAVSVPI